MAKQTKYIFVTGGVVSSLGKGIAASCIGRLLKNRGLNHSRKYYSDGSIKYKNITTMQDLKNLISEI